MFGAWSLNAQVKGELRWGGRLCNCLFISLGRNRLGTTGMVGRKIEVDYLLGVCGDGDNNGNRNWIYTDRL